MQEVYEVRFQGRQMGSAVIRREGLYCRVTCQCEMADSRIYVLYAGGDGQQLRLGVPVPQRGMLFLETKIPAKRFPEKIRELYLLEKGNESSTTIPLIVGMPVESLEKLTDAKLRLTPDGVQLIITKGQST